MITVYTPDITPRLRYIFHFIFHDILNVPYTLCTDRGNAGNTGFVNLNYSDDEIDGAIKIKPHRLLFESEINKQHIEVSEWKDTKVFFVTDATLPIPFDLFAAGFFLLSRYEEYLISTKDAHGRFAAEASLAYQYGFLEEPVIDQWAYLLARHIKESFPDLIIQERAFRYIPTIDVDVAFAYRHKGLGRTFGAIAKDLIRFDFAENISRFRAILGLDNDPFDTYELLENLHNKYGYQAVYFFLVGRYSTFDKNHSLRRNPFRNLIKRISVTNRVGIHPSYLSNNNFAALKMEVDGLSELLGYQLELSRQHFLKLSLPETYRNLLKLGIKEDYTMGYASKPGFRAGTCTSFAFYDLLAAEQTMLRVYPFQVMDVTLTHYLKLSRKEAVEKISKIVNSVRAVHGTFVSLWHNESLSELHNPEEWTGIYEEMLNICKNQ